MTSFDSNTWYQILHDDDDGTVLGTGGVGPTAIHLKTPNATSENQQWQILTSTSSESSTSVFLLRNHELGAQFYLNTFCDDQTNCAGTSYAAMSTSDTPADATSNQEWLFEDDGAGDSGFRMIDLANGTNYYLDVDGTCSGCHVLMGDDSGSSGIKWQFSSIGAIDDPTWSTTATSQPSTSSAASTSTASTTTTQSYRTSSSSSPTRTNTQSASSATTATTPTSSSSHHVAIAAVIAAVIGGITIIALFIAAFVLFRRKKQPRLNTPPLPIAHHELESRSFAELPTQQTTWDPSHVDPAQRWGPRVEMYDYRRHTGNFKSREKEPVEMAAEVFR